MDDHDLDADRYRQIRQQRRRRLDAASQRQSADRRRLHQRQRSQREPTRRSTIPPPARGQVPAAPSFSCGISHGSYEVGPAVLRPDGTVFATGANGAGAGHTSIYNTANGPGRQVRISPTARRRRRPCGAAARWQRAGQRQPGHLSNWHVLLRVEWDEPDSVPATPNSPVNSSWYGRMLVLPTGQVLYTRRQQRCRDLHVRRGNANPALAHRALAINVTLTAAAPSCSTAANSMALRRPTATATMRRQPRNYPIVRFTNIATGHVFYGRTHDHNTMAVGYTRPDLHTPGHSGQHGNGRDESAGRSQRHCLAELQIGIR